MINPASQYKQLNKNTRLFLTATIIDGIITSTTQLFFNFFILSRGFDRQFLGLINSLPSLAALLMGLPLGALVDRIGTRKSMMIGLFFQIMGMASILLARPAWLLLLCSFIYGAGSSLYSISLAPFMMQNSVSNNRSFIFTLNFGLQTLAGALASLFAGQLPELLAPVLHTASDSTVVFRFILLGAVVIGSLSFLPIFLIREQKTKAEEKKETVSFKSQIGGLLKSSTVWKLLAPNILISFGAAILIPYINVYFREKFSLPESEIGIIFSISSLAMAAASLWGPGMEKVFRGKIPAVAATQSSSLIFLIILGFVPHLQYAKISYWLRGALMNIASPLFTTYSMEQIPQKSQGAVNSLINMTMTFGYTVGPLISGYVQQRFGFQPLFIATTVLYGLAVVLTWLFFYKAEKGAASLASVP